MWGNFWSLGKATEILHSIFESRRWALPLNLGVDSNLPLNSNHHIFSSRTVTSLKKKKKKKRKKFNLINYKKKSQKIKKNK